MQNCHEETKSPQKYTKSPQKMHNCHKNRPNENDFFTVSISNVRNSDWSVCCGGQHETFESFCWFWRVNWCLCRSPLHISVLDFYQISYLTNCCSVKILNVFYASLVFLLVLAAPPGVFLKMLRLKRVQIFIFPSFLSGLSLRLGLFRSSSSSSFTVRFATEGLLQSACALDVDI